MPSPEKQIRLGERDYDILEHILKYRMTTREVLHHLFFADSKPNAVSKVTSRLTLHEYLCRREDLATNFIYFTLGLKATRALWA
jgi:hypothetical protein